MTIACWDEIFDSLSIDNLELCKHNLKFFLDKVERTASSASSDDSRMTTDAVHRRFIHRDESFYCIKCSKSFKITDLSEHFVNVSHKRAVSCVYCGNAVYQYLLGDRKEVYHYCRYD